MKKMYQNVLKSMNMCSLKIVFLTTKTFNTLNYLNEAINVWVNAKVPNTCIYHNFIVFTCDVLTCDYIRCPFVGVFNLFFFDIFS